MSAVTLCPNPDVPCDFCVQAFLDAHPGAEVWTHTYHLCDCPMVASLTDETEVCVGCREKRDVWAEYNRLTGVAS
jgi:hypothetical protein